MNHKGVSFFIILSEKFVHRELCLTKALYFAKVVGMEINWNEKENKKLLKAILSIENEIEAKAFLRDLLTSGEILECAKRLKTAQMLLDKTPYSTIETETGFSSTTIARVAEWLKNGKGGYKLILNKLHHTSSQKSNERRVLVR